MVGDRERSWAASASAATDGFADRSLGRAKAGSAGGASGLTAGATMAPEAAAHGDVGGGEAIVGCLFQATRLRVPRLCFPADGGCGGCVGLTVKAKFHSDVSSVVGGARDVLFKADGASCASFLAAACGIL